MSIQASNQQDDDLYKDDSIVPSSHNDDYVAEDADIGSERAEHPATNFEIPIQGSKD